MKMSKEHAEWLQYWLADYLPVDSPSPYYFASGEEDHAHWQFVVDMLYILLKSGILDVWPSDYLIKDHECSCDGLEDFCFELARQNPYKLEELSRPPAAWFSPSISITKKGLEIVHHYFDSKYFESEESPLNEKFIEHLEAIFESNGFLPNQGPLFPISNPIAS